jgi:hypothetical protein
MVGQSSRRLLLFLFETDCGHTGLVAAGDRDEARQLATAKPCCHGRRVGKVRPATDDDVKWVRSMGGHVPRVEEPTVSR